MSDPSTSASSRPSGVSAPADPQSRLASLLDLSEPRPEWTADVDLRGLLQSVLDGPSPQGPGLATLRDVLLSGCAEEKALLGVKSWAKARRVVPEAGVSPDVYRVIYFTALAAGQVQGRRISDLSSADLGAGYEWVRALSWTDDPMLRTLIDRALAGIGA